MNNLLEKERDFNNQVQKYHSNFNFEEYEIDDEKIINGIEEKEENILKNIQQINRNRKEMSKNLYEIHLLLSKQKTGTFLGYLNYLGISKDTAYRLIDMWKLFIDTKKTKVFELTHNVVKQLKSITNESGDNQDIVEVIEADNPTERLKELKKDSKVYSTKKNMTSEDIEKEIKRIDKKIEKKYLEIENLEKEKENLSELL
ncbi:hypothetical protein [Sebaldella sp. S0638]|uniref:hypothetical protein n=1 Tax=Sebaldella sp. S0638 TaxID=2957809 RepID=UPI00209D7DB6|nr:hypothetical protein [Sebaldella sp. S0638]MCP1226551.1 hypothetical protein [Sebaldella sp. S0638]